MKLDQIIMYLPPLSTTQKRSIYFYTLPWLPELGRKFKDT